MNPKPDRAQILVLVVAALSKVAGVPPEKIVETHRMQSELGLGSVDVIEVIFEMEKRFGPRVDYAEAFRPARLRRDQARSELSVRDLVDYLVQSI